MKKLELKQMESFVGGRDCMETPLQTDLQMQMCLIQAEEDENYVFAPYGPNDVMYWLDRMFMGGHY